MPSGGNSVYPSLVRLSNRALFILVVVLAGCGEGGGGEEGSGGERREWRASDHQQPTVPDPEATPPEAEAPTEEVIARAAAALYGARCATCHGVEGRGDGAEAPIAEMPNFTSAEYQDGRSDADLVRAIRMGSGLMPAFGQQLNERGIGALVTHIRSLRGGE